MSSVPAESCNVEDDLYRKIHMPLSELGTNPNMLPACPCLKSREARPRSGVCCAPPEEASKKICVRSKYWPRRHQGEVSLTAPSPEGPAAPIPPPGNSAQRSGKAKNAAGSKGSPRCAAMEPIGLQAQKMKKICLRGQSTSPKSNHIIRK